LIGRQAAAPPVANVPTPTPALTPTATPSPAPPTPTTAPTPTPTPSPVPPTTPPTTPPTLPPTVPPSAPAALDPPTAEDFAAALLTAFQTGDTAYLIERIHPAVFERYGERQCRRHVNGFEAEPDAEWTFVSSSGPAPWDWVTDDVTTTINDTWTVTIDEPDAEPRDLHFAPFEGTWRWFTDCGRPR